MTLVWVIIGILGIVGLIIAVAALSGSNPVEDNKNAIEQVINDKSIHVTSSYDFHSDRISDYYGQYAYRFVVDDNAKQIHFINGKGGTYTFDYKEIIGMKTLEDSAVTGSIGRAVIGGIIAGEAGAIVGAVTAKKKIQSFKIMIYTNKVSYPVDTITLINQETLTSSPVYQEAKRFSERVSGTIKAILSRSQNNQNLEKKQINAQQSYSVSSKKDNLQAGSKVDRLLKLKELLDNGAITQVEYEKLKKN